MVFLVGLLLVAFAGLSEASVTAIKDSTWTSWPSTIYYFSELKGPNAPYSGYTVYITAVDKYELYINGKRIDTPATNDNNSATVDSIKVTGQTQSFFVAVKVENLGQGNGNGLIMFINAGSDTLGTTTQKRFTIYDKVNKVVTSYPAIWKYYPGDIVSAVKKADWYNFDHNFMVNTPDSLGVIFGQIPALKKSLDPHVRIVSGYYGGVETGSANGGGMSLRLIDGENLAYKKPCQEIRLVDGDIASGWVLDANPVGQARKVFLNDYYRLIGMRIYTGGDNPQDWLDLSVKGYYGYTATVDPSYTLQAAMSNAGVSNANNGGYDYSELFWPAVFGRFVQFTITEARSGNPHLGEFMVFGTGHIWKGSYISPYVDFGDSALKNIGTVTWDGILPQGSTISIQTKSVNADGVESDWSIPHTEKSFEFDSPEPAKRIRYQVNLATDGVDLTPVLKTLKINYSNVTPNLVSGNASILPHSIPMGVDTTLTYSILYKLGAGQNIKTVAITIPNFSVVDSVYLSDTNTTLTNENGFTAASTSDSLYVTFSSPVTNTAGTGLDTMKIYFRTSIWISLFNFESGLYDSGTPPNDGAGMIKLAMNPSESWLVTTSAVKAEALTNVKVLPKAFTPNNDGKNDFTVIEFTLANILQTRVFIKIYNTDGSLVTTLYNKVLTAGDYRILDSAKSGRGSQAKNLPGYWDGKDKDGKLVPPGVYIWQVTAKMQVGDKTTSGTVAVAY
jgi:hypothetical protein